MAGSQVAVHQRQGKLKLAFCTPPGCRTFNVPAMCLHPQTTATNVAKACQQLTCLLASHLTTILMAAVHHCWLRLFWMAPTCHPTRWWPATAALWPQQQQTTANRQLPRHPAACPAARSPPAAPARSRAPAGHRDYQILAAAVLLRCCCSPQQRPPLDLASACTQHGRLYIAKP